MDWATAPGQFNRTCYYYYKPTGCLPKLIWHVYALKKPSKVSHLKYKLPQVIHVLYSFTRTFSTFYIGLLFTRTVAQVNLLSSARTGSNALCVRLDSSQYLLAHVH